MNSECECAGCWGDISFGSAAFVEPGGGTATSLNVSAGAVDVKNHPESVSFSSFVTVEVSRQLLSENWKEESKKLQFWHTAAADGHKQWLGERWESLFFKGVSTPPCKCKHSAILLAEGQCGSICSYPESVGGAPAEWDHFSPAKGHLEVICEQRGESFSNLYELSSQITYIYKKNPPPKQVRGAGVLRKQFNPLKGQAHQQ